MCVAREVRRCTGTRRRGPLRKGTCETCGLLQPPLEVPGSREHTARFQLWFASRSVVPGLPVSLRDKLRTMGRGTRVPLQTGEEAVCNLRLLQSELDAGACRGPVVVSPVACQISLTLAR